MDFKAFSLKVIVLTSGILLALLLLTKTYSAGGYQMVSLLLCVMIAFMCYVLLRTIASTNTELSRFLEAARHADFSQRFEMKEMGTGFTELGATFDQILKQFQAERAAQDEKLKHLKAIIENVPVPLISVQPNQYITLWNNAARRLFGNHIVQRLSDLNLLGIDVEDILTATQSGNKELVQLHLDGMNLQLSVSVAHITTTKSQETLIAMQDIRSELDARQQESWQDLVRVLTHEIMNSITPVASLAKTAADLVSDAKTLSHQNPKLQTELDDIEDAVTTVAKRSDNLMKFVSSYRKLTRLPAPNKKRLVLKDMLDQIAVLISSTCENDEVKVAFKIQPENLTISADKEQTEQMFINLLRNAVQATQEQSSADICVAAHINKRNHVVIEITDNGPGISEEVLENIFVPFFTTKRDGSGVGLALSRQIMLAHGGSIQAGNTKDGGAKFTLVF
ncbi:MAG: PAS domain-containing sensor histidine kinase [Aestuariibacter sp.]